MQKDASRVWADVLYQELGLGNTAPVSLPGTCEAVPRRAGIEGSYNFVSLNSRFESHKEEEPLHISHTGSVRAPTYTASQQKSPSRQRARGWWGGRRF